MQFVLWSIVSERTAYLRAAETLRDNPGQWAAYESRNHCVVLAGPGSGKTKTLTTKIARLLAEDIAEPRGLACITYNNECARELEERLNVLGIEPGGRVFIGTVHSFSLTQIILPYAKAAQLSLPDDFGIANRDERMVALERALQRPIGNYGGRQDVEFRMGNYRRTILNRGSQEWSETDSVLACLVEAYEQELRGMGLIDFDDMPLLAVRALRNNPWLQRALLAKYPVLLVDEYQDLGLALHRMVMELCFRAGVRLFAVGDPDQSIYGFTGARPDLLRRLSERADVEPVRLRLNYRSGTQIVAASGFALGEERDYQAVQGASEGTVFFHPLAGNYEHQAAQLMAELVPQAIGRHPGLQYGDIAVLYPAAWIGDAVAAAAQQRNIPILRTDGNALYPRSSRVMRWLEQCAEWCCGGWRLGVPLFSRVANEGKRLFSEAILTRENAADFHRNLIAVLWNCRVESLPLNPWLVQLREDLMAPLTRNCMALRDELEILNNFIDRTSSTGDCRDMLLGQFASQSKAPNRVNLSTLHSAKGREFAVVFIFGIDIGKLPRSGSSQQQHAEARRLFYVGFTRAKTEIHLVHTALRPSPFIVEIQQRLRDEVAR